MVNNDSPSQNNYQQMGKLLISLTGETGTTDQQNQEQYNRVIDVTGLSNHPDKSRPDADFESNGLEDAITR